jgi:hypothetical protein
MRLVWLSLLPSCLWADTLTFKDGSFLRGQIERIADGVVEMSVPTLKSLAPVQRFPLKDVESFITDDPVALSGAGGAVVRGVAAGTAGRATSSGGPETFELNNNFELWREPQSRPLETKEVRKWTMEADIDLSGRSGSISGSGYSAGFKAKAVTADDTFTGSIRAVYAISGDQTSADDLHLNLIYETNPKKEVFWYARTDTGYDYVRYIDFFSINAAGLGQRLYTDARGKLDFHYGLAHRYEEYTLAGRSPLSAPSADTGIIFTHEFTWATFEMVVNYVPSLLNLGDYYIHHESTLNVLRNSGPLSLKLGITNDLRSNPLANQAALETTYFLRAAYVWK